MEDKLLKQILSEVQGVHTRLEGVETRLGSLESGQKELYLLSRGWEEDRHILRHLEEKFSLNQGNYKKLEKKIDALDCIIGRHDRELQELKNQSA